jgi:Predicted nucleotide-binding protein containing TIR-like domain
MKRSVFYSWQSDLDSNENRNLIEDALKNAIKSIRKDESKTVEPVLDRDTAGISGSPSISESIFAKISLADVFLADVSIINKGSDKRLTPNPNVLIELGYAIAVLGWNRILLVQNTNYGEPEDLPFDLRGRRIIAYNFEKTAGNRSEARGLLQGRLETALTFALSNSTMMSLPTGPNAPLWWGRWNMGDSNEQMFGGKLNIREVSATGFLFNLDIVDGARTGSLSAYAQIISTDLAYARVINGEDNEIGELVFRRRTDVNSRTIEIEETASCSFYCGLGASFSGKYIRVNDFLFDHGFVNELELSRIYNISGIHYESLRNRFVQLGNPEKSEYPAADVIIGGVQGLYTTMEGILMRGEKGELWVAYIDDDVVRYFSTENDWGLKLPNSIEVWRERFKEKPVVFYPKIEFSEAFAPQNRNKSFVRKLKTFLNLNQNE